MDGVLYLETGERGQLAPQSMAGWQDAKTLFERSGFAIESDECISDDWFPGIIRFITAAKK